MTDFASLQRAARQQLWREGRAAEYLLDEGQRAWVTKLSSAPPASWTAWKIARQRGKTFAALVWLLQRMGLERALTGVYLAQTGGNAEAIVTAFFREVEEDLPPEWGVALKEGALVVQASGSELAVFGTDNKQYRRRRGRKAKVVLLDESAFYEDLLDVEQVYVPQLQTTGGIGLYLSSPPISPAHPFNDRCRAALASGRFQHDTFWSNPRINHEQVIRGEMERLNLSREELLASTAFRREYLAEDVTEETRAALPGWSEELAKLVVGDWVRPEFFDAYQAHDPGKVGDPHASLFGFHDPEQSVLVIEDEMELRSAAFSTRQWADKVKAKESDLYGVNSWNGTLAGAKGWLEGLSNVPEWIRGMESDSSPRQPFLRVGDNADDICHDMTVDHGLAMLPAEKHNKALEMSNLNHALVHGKIRIHSRCVRLIQQCYTTVWNRTRTAWERTATDHGDLIDDLQYIHRSIYWHRDCRPPKRVDPYLFKPKETSGWSKLVR